MRNTRRHRRTGEHWLWGAPVVGIWLALSLGAPLHAQQPADDDTIELAPITGEGASERSLTPHGEGPVQLSVLDVLTRLALLVLAVYGAAWGIGAARKSGLRLGRTALACQNVRLRECERLALSPSVSLHVIEVDHRPIIIASSGGGEVRLLLDLGQSACVEEPSAQPQRPGLPAPTSSPERLSFSVRDDAEWQERRDALIRSLARGG